MLLRAPWHGIVGIYRNIYLMQTDRNRGLNPQDEGRNADVSSENSYDKPVDQDDANTGLPGRSEGKEGKDNSNQQKKNTNEEKLKESGAQGK